MEIVSKVAFVIVITVFVLFFLSVFGPMHSKKKFWLVIYKIRKIMDAISYWFYVSWAAAAVVVFAVTYIKKLV